MAKPLKQKTSTRMRTRVPRSGRRGGVGSSPGGGRAGKSGERRSAILAAALEEFSARGFAATRLDDVARRAGVAKGTIYLYFKDKEALFQELIQFQLSPVMHALQAALASPLPLTAIMDQALEIFVREVYGTHRRQVMRLVITEGARFPAIAEFYYHQVLAGTLKAIRARLVRAREAGEIADDVLVRFPQLLGAAPVMAVVWEGLFGRFDPLDVRAMLRAYFDRIFDVRRPQ